jgi:hypothetical protein
LVASERSPVVLAFCVDALRGKNEVRVATFRTAHPILDIAAIDSSILVASDVRSDSDDRLHGYRMVLNNQNDSQEIEFDHDTVIESQIESMNALESNAIAESELEKLIYGIANLRKRGHSGQLEAESPG